MNISESNKIMGLTDGILYGQNERVDELNTRILARFRPDQPLQPNLDVRAVPTKYSHFPIIDRIVQPRVQLNTPLDYSVETNFLPTNSNGPVDGYFSNVNTESSLRNQYFAIQKGAPQSAYIPSSNSELYSVKMAAPSQYVDQPYPKLFDRYTVDPFAKQRQVNPTIGGDRFFNNTRTQLRGGKLASV